MRVPVIDRTRAARAPFEVRAAVCVQVNGLVRSGKLRYAVCVCVYDNDDTAAARAPSFGLALDGRVVWCRVYTTAVVEQFIG